MRVTGIDALKGLVLLTAMAGAGCMASWGAGDPAAREQSPQGNLAAGGKGVAPRIAPSSAEAEAEDDCARARAAARGSTRLVYQGTGQPPREDSSDTTNLADTGQGPTYPAAGDPTRGMAPPAQAAKRKPGC